MSTRRPEGRVLGGFTAAIALLATVALCRAAHAGKHPRFEPTDLALSDPGLIQFDLQAGPVAGPDANRIVLPDFEVNLGILPNLELDLDGAYAIEGVPRGMTGRAFLDHSALDNLWVSAKLGLWADHDANHNSWALGVQLGPKLPAATDTHGLGFEGLALIARMMGRVHLVGQVGALVDPREGTSPRPFGIEGGLDLDLDLTIENTWSLLGELGGIWYGSDDASQLAATLGIQWSPSSKLDLSIVAMVGFLDGSDPVGLMFGASPKISLW